LTSVHFHIDEINWQIFNPFPKHESSVFKSKELLNRERGKCKEWIFGAAELPADGRFPFHVHQNDMIIYILSGQAKVQLGARSVEVEPFSGVYFPAGKPHVITALGTEPLKYIYTYVCEKTHQTIDWELADENTAAQVIIENKPDTRWAIHEEFEKWEFWEPSKGSRLRYKTLFDNERGNTQKGVAIFDVAPNTHYTRHFHGTPEIYYIVSGHGIMYVRDSEYEVKTGSALYIGPNIIHGIDNLSEESLKTYVVYDTKALVGWTPVEDVYTEARRT